MNEREAALNESKSAQLRDVDPSIFRAYDVRGLVDENLNPDVVYAIGRAFGSELRERSRNHVAAIGRDGRASSLAYLEAMAQGLCQSGIDVINLGLIPTPLVHYGALKLDAGAAVVITGSHNPPAYNGLKFAMGHVPFSGDKLALLRERVDCARFKTGNGNVRDHSVIDEYVLEVAEKIHLTERLHVVIDCGNGAAGVLARRLYEALGCKVTMLYEDVDSAFPNHHPDPAVPANLIDLRSVVVDLCADAGIAFDGDGDRVGVVTDTGENVWADRLLALFANDVLSRFPGEAVVFDVKCGTSVRNAISRCGGRPVLSPTGHTNITHRVCQHQAVLGGEFSGHFCFPDRWYLIDDAAYAGARFLELVCWNGTSASEMMASIERNPSTPEILIPVEEQRKFEIMERLARCASFTGGNVADTDGIRVDFEDGWGLVRASNTSPKLSLRFEAETSEALLRIQQLFKHELLRIEPGLVSQAW